MQWDFSLRSQTMTNPLAAYSQRVLTVSVQLGLGRVITLLNVSTLLHFKIQEGKCCISHL